jgi:hypothetical protein
MPAAIKIRVLEARDLPVMDRATELTDAYVELRFADNAARTTVARRTLNPQWHQDFRFEIADDCDLQDHPLLLTCWDKDLMSSDDEIGAVSIDLNPLLQRPMQKDRDVHQLQGWYPLYDTLRGVRGELSVVVKMDFIGDVNPFKESGAGVTFYAMPSVPPGGELLSLVGLVEELVVVDDPESHWLDPIRTARLSNERRQHLLYQLCGKIRRQMGRKVLEAGGNAVLGFDMSFDLEGEDSVRRPGSNRWMPNMDMCCRRQALPSLSLWYSWIPDEACVAHARLSLSLLRGCLIWQCVADAVPH